MEGLELYSFFVCLIVYVLLIVVFTLIISSIYSMNIKLIRHGIEDERILKELHNKRKSKTVMQIVSTIISVLFSMCFVCIFIFSLYVKYIDPTPSSDIPVLRIVKSDSMSYKDEDNEYLFENDINNQFDTFDLIFTYQLPDEYELELYV